MIRFNVPHITGKEMTYIQDAISRGRLSGDGYYSEQCRKFFNKEFDFTNNFLTTSGTDALEMAALLMEISPGDEIIMPSYTFVSTANAFVLRGARIVFADSLPDHPNIDHTTVASLITKRTKALVVVHYGGVACDMTAIMQIAEQFGFVVIEDAAHSIDSYYQNKALGTFGDYAAFSFHETKNINCGEGGLLVVRDELKAKRAEIIREKGTNRSAFFRGEIDKYGWVDIGSSFLPSELLAAFLFAQLESLTGIQERRKQLWTNYLRELKFLEKFGYQLPFIPSYATNNGHLFYLLCPSLIVRTELIEFLSSSGIKSVFHYLPLHRSKYYLESHNTLEFSLPNAERYGDTLLRLPIYSDLKDDEQLYIIDKVSEFVKSRKSE